MSQLSLCRSPVTMGTTDASIKKGARCGDGIFYVIIITFLISDEFLKRVSWNILHDLNIKAELSGKGFFMRDNFFMRAAITAPHTRAFFFSFFVSSIFK